MLLVRSLQTFGPGRALVRLAAIAVVAAAGGLAGACAGLSHDYSLSGPSVFEQVGNADLSARGPQRVDSEQGGESQPIGGYSNASGAQSYPGSDVVGKPRVYGASKVLKTGSGFELNFNGAEMAEFVKVILGDTLQASYYLDPRVQGSVTVASGRELSEQELLETLETILQMNKAALVKSGAQYQVIPLSEARASSTVNIDYVAEARAIGPGYGVTVLPLKFASAGTMMSMINAFIAQAGTVRADINRNLLLLRGSSAERQSIADVALTFDVDWLKGQSAGIFPVRHTSPEEIIQELETIFQTKNGELGSNLIKLQPIERLNAVLVITPRAHVLQEAAQWLKRLDRANTAGVNLYVYRVENAKAKDLAAVLNSTFAETSDTRSAAAEIAPGQAVVEASASAGGPLGSGGISGTVVEPSEESGEISAFKRPSQPQQSASEAPKSVRIVADEVNNKILIRASERDYRKIIGILRRLDRAPLQVLINATLAEVTLNDNLRYGVQAYLKETNRSPFGSVGFSNTESLVVQPQLPGLSFLAGLSADPKIVLDALANETNVRVVSSPSVVVVNNQPAKLQVGDEVPISTRQATSVTDPEAPIVNNIEFRETGVILNVTPRVSSDGLVTMEIEQEISNVAATTAEGGAGTLTPTISQRRITSTISVYSGQMVVLGGLISERRSSLKNRVPIWEKIPILGEIPGKTDNALTRTELVIFLQPQVISNPADASMIAEELRARIQSLEPDKYRKYERWPKRGAAVQGQYK